MQYIRFHNYKELAEAIAKMSPEEQDKEVRYQDPNSGEFCLLDELVYIDKDSNEYYKQYMLM